MKLISTYKLVVKRITKVCIYEVWRIWYYNYHRRYTQKIYVSEGGESWYSRYISRMFTAGFEVVMRIVCALSPPLISPWLEFVAWFWITRSLERGKRLVRSPSVIRQRSSTFKCMTYDTRWTKRDRGMPMSDVWF